MSDPHDIRLTQGHVLRHAPAQSPQGRDAAVIDIAQDLLLRHLSERGVLTLVAFKGGTALRKVHAGAAGRFSTDLDFAVAALDDAEVRQDNRRKLALGATGLTKSQARSKIQNLIKSRAYPK